LQQTDHWGDSLIENGMTIKEESRCKSANAIKQNKTDLIFMIKSTAND